MVLADFDRTKKNSSWKFGNLKKLILLFLRYKKDLLDFLDAIKKMPSDFSDLIKRGLVN